MIMIYVDLNKRRLFSYGNSFNILVFKRYSGLMYEQVDHEFAKAAKFTLLYPVREFSWFHCTITLTRNIHLKVILPN